MENYCSRYVEPFFFVGNKTCLRDRKLLLEAQAEGIEQDYFQQFLGRDGFVIIASYQERNKFTITSFLLAVQKDPTTLTLESFCNDPAALWHAFPRETDYANRPSIQLYKVFEQIAKKRGYTMIELQHIPLSEYFWYKLGYRYTRCDAPSQSEDISEPGFVQGHRIVEGHCADTQTQPPTMYKCI